MKVLMVCLGNICRSPMAEGILRHHATLNGLQIEIDSAGTGSYHVGEAPDKRAIQYMHSKGHDISLLRARQFSKHDFDAFDTIYAMDDSNYNNILCMATNDEHRSKVKMILNEAFDKENRSVPDPYFGGMEGFEEVYQLLDHSSKVIVGRLLK